MLIIEPFGLVICLSISVLRAFWFLLFECVTIGVDFKFADRKCLILEKFLIRNCGCYKPFTMGNPGCCEFIDHNDLVVFLVLCI